MCGIAGLVADARSDRREIVSRMIDAIRHRGPDGDGVHEFPDACLGHVRLSIVDIEGGAQPMLTPDGRVGVTFNGEIYGYREIRSRLGRAFRTESDTEVLLELYLEHGRGMMPHLPGMFAFAVYDDRKKRLFAARDRFGEKPFYYARTPAGGLVFASEMKAITASGLVDPILREESVANYLRFRAVAPHHSIFRNVFVLPPAHSLTFENGELEVREYWSPPPAVEGISLPDAVDEFRALFEQAVARQLVADVPVGAFLSGGLDSTTIVGAASGMVEGFRTYSFGFEDISELPFADAAARRYGTDHTVLVEEDADLASLLLEMQRVYDEPFADSSGIPTWLIAKQARAHTKVVVGGDGADELLGGYADWRYRELMFAAEGIGFPELVTLKLRRAVEKLLPFLGGGGTLTRKKLRGRKRRRRCGSVAEALVDLESKVDAAGLAALGLSATGHDLRFPEPQSGTVDDALRIDLRNYLPGDVLTKTDRATMAHGLELRAPFLDVDLASFCIGLPWRLKIDERRDKILLREAYEATWPESIRTRGKQGFGAPVGLWLTYPSIVELEHEYLGNRNRRIFDVLDYDGVARASHGDRDLAWALLVLALWMEEHSFSLSS